MVILVPTYINVNNIKTTLLLCRFCLHPCPTSVFSDEFLL